MVKNIDTTKNYLYKLIKKKRHKNMSMYTVGVSLAKYEQVFLCYNQLNSFNATDLLWPLKVTLKSFIQSFFDFFCFHLLFLKFVAMILKFSLAKQTIMVFLNAVFEHVWLVISSIVVFNTFMYTTYITDVIFCTCW